MAAKPPDPLRRSSSDLDLHVPLGLPPSQPCLFFEASVNTSAHYQKPTSIPIFCDAARRPLIHYSINAFALSIGWGAMPVLKKRAQTMFSRAFLSDLAVMVNQRLHTSQRTPEIGISLMINDQLFGFSLFSGMDVDIAVDDFMHNIKQERLLHYRHIFVSICVFLQPR